MHWRDAGGKSEEQKQFEICSFAGTLPTFSEAESRLRFCTSRGMSKIVRVSGFGTFNYER